MSLLLVIIGLVAVVMIGRKVVDLIEERKRFKAVMFAVFGAFLLWLYFLTCITVIFVGRSIGWFFKHVLLAF